MSFLAALGGQLLGKWASSAIDSHFAHQQVQNQLKAQKELFAYENQNKHQFEVQDLRAAGLNPILSATNGNAIGVGGVSAPNWTSDDDLFNPASALQIQQKQVRAQEMSAEAALIQAKNGQVASSARANLDNTSASIAWMKAGAEQQILFKGIEEADARIKYLHGQFDEVLSRIPVNKAQAKKILEDTVGQNLSNREFEGFVKMVEELEKDPGMQGTMILNSARVAKYLPHLTPPERMGLVASLTDWSMYKRRRDKPNNNASSAISVFNNYDDLFEYGGVRE